MTKKIIIANWKMNQSFEKAQFWVENINKKLSSLKVQNLPEIVLCPPALMIDYIDGILMEKEFEEIEKIHSKVEEIEESELEKLIEKIRIIQLGAQDCSQYENGAHTGDISANLLKDAGAKYVIVGHSERRQYQKESNQIISEKIGAAVKEGLIPVLCVGESIETRESGAHKEFIAEQLKNSLPRDLKITRLIIAYEPIWSIGSGKIPTITQIEEISSLIKIEVEKYKNISRFQILYGGSLNQDNSKEIIDAQNVNGLLVGGASLDDAKFFEIIRLVY